MRDLQLLVSLLYVVQPLKQREHILFFIDIFVSWVDILGQFVIDLLAFVVSELIRPDQE